METNTNMLQLKTGKCSSFIILSQMIYKIETQQNARTMIILIFPLISKSPSQKNADKNVISSFWKKYFGLFFDKYAKYSGKELIHMRENISNTAVCLSVMKLGQNSSRA